MKGERGERMRENIDKEKGKKWRGRVSTNGNNCATNVLPRELSHRSYQRFNRKQCTEGYDHCCLPGH